MFNQTNWGYSNMSVKINAGKNKEAISFIQSIWQKNCGDIPFEYQFLDEHFEEMYRADLQIGSIVGALAALAIIVACLGLFGLASYSAERRTKEVGIRKVLGASLKSIVLNLSMDFLKWVGLAALIAWPLSWFAVHKWLQDYAYRTPINWWVFLGAVLIAIAIAFLTICIQTIRAGLANPVKSLRTNSLRIGIGVFSLIDKTLLIVNISVKILSRILWKKRSFSLLNITGLAVGIAASLLIFLVIRNEFSYDRFHTNKNRIYRVISDLTNKSNGEIHARAAFCSCALAGCNAHRISRN